MTDQKIEKTANKLKKHFTNAISKKAAKEALYFSGKYVLLTLFALLLVVATDTDLKKALHKNVKVDDILLSTVDGEIVPGKAQVKIFKIKRNGKIFVEIFKVNNRSLEFHSRIPIQFAKDSYLTFNEVSTNLALMDIDGDQVNEIIVPGISKGFSPGLVVFKYDTITNDFYQLRNNEMLISANPDNPKARYN